jgi:hypothetical protein
MSDPGIRESESERQIFHDIFLSLESKRTAKSEKDILDAVQEKFGLPGDRKSWPDVLIANGTPVEKVLDFVFEQLGPFVQMILELYRFLSEWVSTTGGRTTHFEIKAEDMKFKLDFPNVDFPKRVKWIEEWTRLQTRLVSVDWQYISQALIIDNGIFYGSVRDFRLLQSLIIGRREGTISNDSLNVARRLNQILRTAVRAWWVSYRASNPLEPPHGQRWIANVFVPQLHHQLVQQGVIRESDEMRSYVGIDIEAVLEDDGASLVERDIFRAPNEANITDDDVNRFAAVKSALFLVALWRLNDTAFRRVTSVLNYHEAREGTLKGPELNERAGDLGEELLRGLEAAIVATDEVEDSVKRIRRKTEILLLPYWKDRWFLYEVWVLILPLIEAASLGSRIELLGIEPIANEGVEGTSWNLPTQKARNPVASLSGPRDSGKLLVWFQRETRSRSADRNIEPDIRITKATSGYDDLLILECKDRVKFGKTRMTNVAQLYLDGSLAQRVWMVNYEDVATESQQRIELDVINDRVRGIAYHFKPGITDVVRRSIRELLAAELSPPRPLTYLVIDISGSMRGKRLPPLATFGRDGVNPAAKVLLWSDSLEEIAFDNIAHAESMDQLHIRGAESPELIAQFAASLPVGAPLTVITDSSGKTAVESSVPRANSQIAGHPVTFIVI